MVLPSSPELLIELKQVCRRVKSPDKWLLNNVSYQLSEGERVAITGPSGSGKSVLLRSIALLDGIDEGQILWRNATIGGNLVPDYRAHVIYLHQHAALFAGTVRSNLELPYQLRHYRGQQFESDRLRRQLISLNRTEQFLNQSVRNLSGGERQMVAMLRALQLKPDVLLLDEPLEGLAPVICDHLMAVFEDLARDGSRSVVLVEQHAEAALRFATRAVLMSNGRIVFNGPADELTANPDLLHRHVGVGMDV